MSFANLNGTFTSKRRRRRRRSSSLFISANVGLTTSRLLEIPGETYESQRVDIQNKQWTEEITKAME